MTRLLVATTNRGKLEELSAMLAPLGFVLEGLGAFPGVDVPEETGATFAENAILKARHYARATGRTTLADDSGLEVRALDGEPGVRSARYAGDDADDASNRTHLLARMGATRERQARFVCAVALVDAAGDGAPLVATGTCEGHILTEPRGQGGFGYDSLFVPEAGDGRTFAELSRDEKRLISHRGHALAALAAILSARTNPGFAEGTR